MSELQTESVDDGITLDNDHVEDIENQQQDEGTVESGSDLATEAEEKQDKAQDGVQKAINKQHAKFKEEERKRIASEDEARELREKLEAIEAENGDVTIPPMPDAYDEDFDQKVAARENAIRQQAVRDAQQSVIAEQKVAAKKDEERAEQDRINSLVSGYEKRTALLGLDANEISKAGDVVVSYGIAGELAEFILNDDDGPLITKYLAGNPLELDDLRNMPITQATIKINSTIRESASAMKPQASTAPDPVETLQGRGASEKVDPFIAGATFT